MSSPEQPSWTDKKGWQRGDDAEKELIRQEGLHAVAESRALREKERGKPGIAMAKAGDKIIGAVLKSASKGMTDSELSLMLREKFRAEVEPYFYVFRSAIEKSSGTFRQTFELDDRGWLLAEKAEAYVRANENDENFDENNSAVFLECAVPTGKPTKHLGLFSYTADDLLTTARLITDKYPDISFEFPPDQKRQKFSYIATLRKAVTE